MRLCIADERALRLRKKSVEEEEQLVPEAPKGEAQCDPIVILPFVLHLSFMVATAFLVMHVQVSFKQSLPSHSFHFLEISLNFAFLL